MPRESTGDTRTRLVDAAVALIGAAPGEDFSLRSVCETVGVTMPTAYHFFGSKQGLIDAVVERGFEQYQAVKSQHEPSGDPMQDLRDGWDAHVAFGLAHPGLYAHMYGSVRPGYVPEAQSRPSARLLELTQRAADQGRLVVSPRQAAAHVLVANVGVTLRQITLGQADPELSAAVRDGVIVAITGIAPGIRSEIGALHGALEYATAHQGVLGAAETRLLREWLLRLAETAQLR